MQQYRLIIEGEPKGKGRPRMNKKGWLYTPQKTREYEKKIKNSYEGPIFTNAIYIRIQAFYKMPKITKNKFPLKKPDIDNVVKIILDSLNGIAYKDDKQIVWLTAVKKWSKSYPRVEVTITEWVEK